MTTDKNKVKDAKVKVVVTFGQDQDGRVCCRVKIINQYEVLENAKAEDLKKMRAPTVRQANAGNSIWAGLSEALENIITEEKFTKQYQFELQPRQIARGSKVGCELGMYLIQTRIFPSCTVKVREQGEAVYKALLEHCEICDSEEVPV